MVPDPSLQPYARPMPRRWTVAIAGTALAMALLLAVALWAEGGPTERRLFKETLAFLIQPYQELFLAGLPGEGGAEYVVFLDDDAPRAALDAFFGTQRAVRFDREGSLPGTIVVTLNGGTRDGLEALRAQPFVRLTVRNQGVFFCH